MGLKKIISQNSFVITSALLCYLILLISIFLLPLEFSGYRKTDSLAPIWYLITGTGGPIGATCIILILLIYLGIHFKRSARRHRDIYIFIGIVFIIQVAIAGVSLYFFKEIFKNPRPSQLYFIEKGIAQKDSGFLSMPSEKRREFLRQRFDSSDNSLEYIYPPILDDWIYESGFSFPSGHSQTAFFLGTILCFVIYKLHLKRIYALLPFLWAILLCISRIVIGIHFPVDVAGGAFIGMMAAFIVIMLKPVNRIFGAVN